MIVAAIITAVALTAAIILTELAIRQIGPFVQDMSVWEEDQWTKTSETSRNSTPS